MKINRLEAHDRLQYLVKDQSANIYKGVEDCLLRNPLSLAIQEKSPYVYLFAHPRTADDGVNKVMYWNPRLSIPIPETNSYLFRAISHSDQIEVCWMIPPEEHWSQYRQGNVTEDNISLWSINQYINHKDKLQRPHPDDLPEAKAKLILKAVIDEHRQKLRLSSSAVSLIV